jgi:hypothetical protein
MAWPTSLIANDPDEDVRKGCTKTCLELVLLVRIAWVLIVERPSDRSVTSIPIEKKEPPMDSIGDLLWAIDPIITSIPFSLKISGGGVTALLVAYVLSRKAAERREEESNQ